MGPPLPLGSYLRTIRRHRYVAAPAGDRPDTFRLWEAIALGALPITELPEPFQRLLGENAVFLPRIEDLLTLSPEQLPRRRPDRRLATLGYWRRWARQELEAVA